MADTVRQIGFRYRILRDSANFGLIEPIEGNWPNIRMDDSGQIKSSFSGTFAPPKFEVDWLTDEIQPELILDGTAYPLGSFRPTTVSVSKNATTESVRIEAYDRCWLARETKTATIPYFAIGTNYIEAISSLLTSCGIGLKVAAATELTLPEAREDWNSGTSYLKMINELLNEINYKELWFDGRGVARLEPYETVSAENILHTLDDRDIRSLMLPSIGRQTDIYNAPNVFVVICSNPDKSGDMTATAVNTSAQSPLSVSRRGRRIVKVSRVNNVASQQALQAMADRQLTDSLVSSETIRVETGLLPGFGVDEITALRYGEIFAVCREKAWTMELSPGGRMTHTLERQVLQIG